MGIFGKKKLPDVNPGKTQEEKDAWRKKQEQDQAQRFARYNEKHRVVTHHDKPDWPRKEVRNKAFRKNSKRARRFYMEVNNG